MGMSQKLVTFSTKSKGLSKNFSFWTAPYRQNAQGWALKRMLELIFQYKNFHDCIHTIFHTSEYIFL